MELNKIIASIEPLDEAAMAEARERQAQLAKPPGSLGRLEELPACGLQAPWQNLLTGVVVIGAVLLDIYRTKSAAKVKKS